MQLNFRLLVLFLFTFSFIYAEDSLETMTLDAYLQQKGFFLSPVHSKNNEGYSSQKQREEFCKDLQNLPDIKSILEIGFNAGHSAEIFLTCTSCQKLVSFDINAHPYTQPGLQFIKQKFGERFEVIIGDSRSMVPKYAASNKGRTFDLIFIDGGHAFECAVADIRNCQQFAHPDTIIWIDDYSPWGVKAAVDFCIKENIITLISAKSVQDLSGTREWAIVRYLSPSERIFGCIYDKALWGKDRSGYGTSGPGSTIKLGQPYIDYVHRFFALNSGIESVVDIGCGDWVLGRAIDWGNRSYIGIDVVEKLIAKNVALFGSEKRHFVRLDVTEKDIPSGDLIICKDVLMHLPNAIVSNVLSKFKKFKYAIIINDVSTATLPSTVNMDTGIGGFRPLDLTASPFFLNPKEVTYYFAGSALKQILLIENTN